MRHRWLVVGVLWIALAGILAAAECGRSPIVVIRWVTETEVDTLGFNLYRAEDPEGPFRQVNPFLILGSTDPLAGAEYEYVDSGVEAGQHYYYQLQEVEIGGTLNRVDLVDGTASGARRWVFLLSAGGVIVGILLCVGGLRTIAEQGGSTSRAEARPNGQTGETRG